MSLFQTLISKEKVIGLMGIQEKASSKGSWKSAMQTQVLLLVLKKKETAKLCRIIYSEPGEKNFQKLTSIYKHDSCGNRL